jgi:hypothetical protein
MLGNSLELYRDLAVVLRGQITHLKARTGDGAGKLPEEALKAHHRALRAVLKAEASLVKRSKADGPGVKLDLDTARAEIVARLAVWVAGR